MRCWPIRAGGRVRRRHDALDAAAGASIAHGAARRRWRIAGDRGPTARTDVRAALSAELSLRRACELCYSYAGAVL